MALEDIFKRPLFNLPSQEQFNTARDQLVDLYGIESLKSQIPGVDLATASTALNQGVSELPGLAGATANFNNFLASILQQKRDQKDKFTQLEADAKIKATDTLISQALKEKDNLIEVNNKLYDKDKLLSGDKEGALVLDASDPQQYDLKEDYIEVGDKLIDLRTLKNRNDINKDGEFNEEDYVIDATKAKDKFIEVGDKLIDIQKYMDTNDIKASTIIEADPDKDKSATEKFIDERTNLLLKQKNNPNEFTEEDAIRLQEVTAELERDVVNPYPEEQAKLYTEIQADVIENSQNTTSVGQIIDDALITVNEPGATTNILTPTLGTLDNLIENVFNFDLNPIIDTFGIDFADFRDVEKLDKLAQQLALSLAPALSGSKSNFEVQQLLTAYFSSGNTNQSNRQFLQNLKYLNEKQKKKEELIRKYPEDLMGYLRGMADWEGNNKPVNLILQDQVSELLDYGDEGDGG